MAILFSPHTPKPTLIFPEAVDVAISSGLQTGRALFSSDGLLFPRLHILFPSSNVTRVGHENPSPFFSV